jgi:transposase
MHDKELYEKLLGLVHPWKVVNVDLNMAEAKVTVKLGHDPMTTFNCPDCGGLFTVYDHRKRSWRHLDTCGFVTIVEADVPRVKCTDHGVKQVSVPWAEKGEDSPPCSKLFVSLGLKLHPLKRSQNE